MQEKSEYKYDKSFIPTDLTLDNLIDEKRKYKILA